MFELKLVFLVNTINLLVVPLKTGSANRIKYLREPTPGTGINRYLNLLFDFGIIVMLWLIVKTTPADISRTASCCNA